jgi:dienelactone hydrolase
MIGLLGADAAAALDALTRQPRIDAARIGLAGGSQAGWIIPRAAVVHPVRFAVILSGPLVSVGEEIYFSDAFENTSLPLSKTDSVMANFRGPTGYDPVPDLRTVGADILWIFGALDRSIPAPRSAQLAANLAMSLGRTNWRVELLPNGDHSLTDTATGRGLDVEAATRSWLTEVLARPLAPQTR